MRCTRDLSGAVDDFARVSFAAVEEFDSVSVGADAISGESYTLGIRLQP
jgi:hypothetical protein